MSTMCRLEKFCCCGTLRCGAIVGAVLNGVIVVSLAALGGVYFSEANVYGKHENFEKQRDWLIKGSIKAIQAVVAVVVLIFFSIGIHRGIAGFVLPWLIVSVILIVIGGINTVIFLSVGHWILAAVWIAVYGFWLYLFIVVLSYYKSLKETDQTAQAPIPMTQQPVNATTPPESKPAAGYSPMTPVEPKTDVPSLYPSFPTETTYTPAPNNAPAQNLYPMQQQYDPPPKYSQV